MRYELAREKMRTCNDMKLLFCRRHHFDRAVENRQKMFARSQKPGETCAKYATKKLQLMEESSFEGKDEKCAVIILASLATQRKRHYIDKIRSLDNAMSSFLKYDKNFVAVEKPKDKVLRVDSKEEKNADASERGKTETRKSEYPTKQAGRPKTGRRLLSTAARMFTRSSERP